MNFVSWLRRKTLCLICISLCAVNLGVISNANAQSLDLDPPLVDHVPADQGIAGDFQSITVTATDSRGIKQVVLFYKLKDDRVYERKEMTLLNVNAPSLYSTSIETKKTDTELSYYFEVVDTGGNRVLNALPFSPHVRTLTAPIDTIAASGSPSLGERLTQPRSWLYVAAGALIIGLIASQSSDSDDPPTGQDSPDTVPVTVQLPTP